MSNGAELHAEINRSSVAVVRTLFFSFFFFFSFFARLLGDVSVSRVFFFVLCVEIVEDCTRGRALQSRCAAQKSPGTNAQVSLLEYISRIYSYLFLVALYHESKSEVVFFKNSEKLLARRDCARSLFKWVSVVLHGLRQPVEHGIATVCGPLPVHVCVRV